jgi:hypothetical protein
VLASAVVFVIGLFLTAALAVDYVRSGLALTPTDRIPYLGVLGLLMLVASFMTFTFVLLIQAAALRAESIYGSDR